MTAVLWWEQIAGRIFYSTGKGGGKLKALWESWVVSFHEGFFQVDGDAKPIWRDFMAEVLYCRSEPFAHL